MKAPLSLYFTAVCLLAAPAAFGLNKGNAGPEEVTLKFKLPPPPCSRPKRP
ncbi:hypothetical protein EMGBS8_02790 [Verrucomicrobiota bacterium]|nr:hypothetical protein EMGBS8_02790 [Verrucomicrobiota bacterium]